MLPPRLSIACVLAVSLAAPVLVGCSAAAEQPILNQFFTASRLRDNTTLAGFSTVAFEPGSAGIINSFTITNVSPEQRKALTLKEIAKTQDDARAEDAEFSKRKEDYANENSEAVQRVVKAGRDAKLKGKDAEIQVAWYKLLDEGVVISRKITDARRTLAAQSGVVSLSVGSDARNAIDVTKRDGELVTKDVTIDAPVKLPDGQTAQKTLVVTMQRAELTGDRPITGRWIITNSRDASGSPATPRS
jgi:hypothetical protein